jgi:hypothetical protein
MSDRMIHLVGSIPFRSSAEVFERVGSILGPRLYSIPDGETGERLSWIGWLEPIFATHPQFESTGQKYTPRATGTEFTGKYRLKAGVSPEEVCFDNLPFARIALESFRDFERVKRTGALPPSVRFQLTLAGPISVIRRFVADEAEQEALIPAYEQGLIAEVGKVASVVPHHQLAVQWDVASAVFERLERGVATRFGQTREEMMRTFVAAHGKLGMGIPSDVQLQFHLCYGDASHMHSIEPSTSRLLVDFANGLRTEVNRSIELVHMPVPRARTDDAYYEPLVDLDLLPETKVALGLVHYSDGIDGTRKRISVAEKYRVDFAVSTECGFGRRDPETIVPLLRLHAEAAGLRK